MWGLGLTYPSVSNVSRQQEGVKLDKREQVPGMTRLRGEPLKGWLECLAHWRVSLRRGLPERALAAAREREVRGKGEMAALRGCSPTAGEPLPAWVMGTVVVGTFCM